MDELDGIVKIQLQQVIDRLARQNLHLHLTEAAIRFLADRGYDPTFGARPLKRAIQKNLLDPLSLKVLEGSFTEGQHLTAELVNGEIEFRTT